MVPSGTLPPLLPRIGLTLALPAGYETFTWYGRGPHENYADRKQSAPLGRFSGAVDDQLYPYIMPQESGNKTDVAWAARHRRERRRPAGAGRPGQRQRLALHGHGFD